MVKLLYIEALQAGASDNHMGGILKAKDGGKSWSQDEDRIDETENIEEHKAREKENIVWMSG